LNIAVIENAHYQRKRCRAIAFAKSRHIFACGSWNIFI
jgi:hypothetical protein